MTPDLLFAALDFYRYPARFAQFRDAARPLPEGVTELLAVPTVSLAPDARAATEDAMGADAGEILDAVRFFARQALLEPDGDHYRTLGVPRDAPPERIKQHYHYLIRLFHPDRDVEGEGWEDLYAPRINEAWQVLRNAERRAAYERVLADLDAPGDSGAPVPPAAPGAGGSAPPSAPHPAPPPRAQRGSRRDAPRSLAARRRWYTSPWPWAVLVILCVAVIFGLFSNQPTTRLTIAEPGRPPLPADAPDHPPGEASGPAPGATDRSDAERLRSIEEQVAARVEAATVAVLGAPRPAPQPKAVATAQPAAAAPAAAPPESAPDPKPAPEPELELALAPPAESVEAPAREPESMQTPPAESAVAPGPVPVLALQAEAVPAPAPEPAPVPQAPPIITDLEVERLMAALARSYERLDAQAYAALFAQNAQTTDASGRAAIEASYRRFFAGLTSSRFETGGLAWTPPGETREGSGTVRVRNQYADAEDPTMASFAMRVVVQREGDGVRIRRMEYR